MISISLFSFAVKTLKEELHFIPSLWTCKPSSIVHKLIRFVRIVAVCDLDF